MPEPRWKTGWFILAILCLLALMWLALDAKTSWADAKPGDSGQEVTEVQYLLRSYGYSLPVDGKYGPITTSRVKHFQKASGLMPDGIAGPITMEALKGASRINPGGGIPGTNSAGLRGMPFPPPGLDNCAEMNFIRIQAGLPDQFSDQPRTGPKSQWGFGWRESNCKNTVTSTTGCCHGYWQLHEGNWSGTAYAPYFREHCQAYSYRDVLGDSPLAKQKNGCVAWVMWNYHETHKPFDGLIPWRL